MREKLAVVFLAAAAAAGCSKEAPPPAPPPPAPIVAPAPPTPPPPAAEPAPAPPRPPAAEPAPAAKAEVAVPAPQAAPAPKPRPPTLATTHGRVGDAKCRMCHKLQHDSWSASPHAAKGLDCEGCHGGGAEFTRVMRDRTAAIAAGLVLPTRDFCKKCHRKDWQEGMYLRVHAHKVK